MKKKILLVSGTRPEIIKLALLFRTLREQDWAEPYWVHTGQHSNMATHLLACFHIEPDYIFQRQGSSLFEFSQGCRAQLESIMAEKKWDLIVVQGDTESTFLGALTGFYHQVPVAHVEAGLRTYRLDRPFPEEGVRQMVARIAHFHFAPTPRARDSLLAEHISPEHIFVTGNTGVDAQKWAAQQYSMERQEKSQQHLLVTIHRRENWGEELEAACHAIATLAERYPEMKVLFPVHLNPVVYETVHKILDNRPNVKLTEPFDYLAMQEALANAWLVVTDSGGLQEEAPTYGVPLLILREETERMEAVESGYAILIGTKTQHIVEQVSRLWQEYDGQKKTMQNPFGDGTACQRIATILQQSL